MKRTLIKDSINWNIQLIEKGGKYGLNNCLTNKGNTLVEFYDTRHKFSSDINEKMLGQFVSRYDIETILKHDTNKGLCLNGSSIEWSISAQGMKQVIDFIKGKDIKQIMNDLDFHVTNNGGGCLAYCKGETNQPYIMITDESGCYLPNDYNGEITIGFYSVDHEMMFTVSTKLKTLINDISLIETFKV